MANNLVALMAEAPKFDSPLESEAKRYKLAQLARQTELDQFALDEARQGQQDNRAVREAYSAYADPKERLAALAKASPKAYQTEAKFQLEQEKSASAAHKDQVESASKVRKMMGSAALAVMDNPTWENAASINAQLKSMLPPSMAANLDENKIPRDPVELKKWANRIYLSSIDPSDKMKDETSRANNATTVGATMRGQDLTDFRQRDANAIAQGNKKDEKLNKAVTDFSGQMEKTNIPTFEATLANIEGKIAKFDKDVPGYGKTGMVPNFMLSDEGKEIRQNIANLRNVILKDRSGAAVTNQELNRLLEELGTGVGMTDADLKRGLAQVRLLLDSTKQNVAAGVTEDVLAEYTKRGGIAIKQGAQTTPPGAPPTGKTIKRTGKLNGRKVVEYTDGTTAYAE